MSKGKQIFKKLYIALFVAMISLPWFIWAGVRIFAPEYYAEQTDLSKEKRARNELNLKELVKSGENLSLYIDDRVPFRGGMIEVYQSTEGKAEQFYQDAMRNVTKFFSGKSRGQKDISNIDSLFGPSDNDTSDNVGDENPDIPSEAVDHEHVFTAIDVVAPDCEHSGYILYKCDYCDYKYKEMKDPLGHDNLLIKESEASYETYGYKQYMCKVCGKLTLENLVPKYVDTTYMAPQIVGGNTMIGRFNWLFYAGEDSLKYYTGENVPTEEELAQYAALVNRLKELCDARGITPVIMFMPNKEQVYPEYMPTSEPVNEYKRIPRIRDYLNTYTSVPCIYPITELQGADLYWRVYYKYDTHWNHMGAFIGLQTLYKTLGMELTNPLLIGAPETAVTRNDLVTLGGLSTETYSGETEYVPQYRLDVTVDGLNSYADVCHTYSNSSNICKLVMISDSYREMMAPYISKDFSECVIAHRNVVDSCADDIRTCNILFITAVERSDKDLFTSIEKIIRILEQ